MEILKNIIFKGQLPWPRVWWKWAFEYLLPLGLIALIAYGSWQGSLVVMTEDLGEWSWNLLLLILFISPISKILPDFGILRTLSSLRRELGVGMFYFGLAHGISALPGYFPAPWSQIPIFIWFGGFALLLTSLLYFTSNAWSMKWLKSYWKKLHRLIYLAFVLVLAHLYFLDPESETLISGILWLGFLIGLKILVWKKVQWRLPDPVQAWFK